MSTRIIFGPPGTGKTTRLLEEVYELMAECTDTRTICYIAFTRKAANEAKGRAMEKFNLSMEELPLFRTLHSLAFHTLGITRTQIMGISDYFEIAKQLGLYLTMKGVSEDGTISGLSKGDRLLFMEQMARSRNVPLKEYWERFPDDDIRWYELLRVHEAVAAYKDKVGKLDFIDMVYKFIKERPNVGHTHLIVDEAQDLSPTQWDMVNVLMETAEETIIAGDDDQAIFTWAGADVNRLLNLPGERTVLDQSYRVPDEVWNVATAISNRISVRVEKKYHPTDKAGIVEHTSSLEDIDMSKGTWLLLARNMFLLQQFNNHCIRDGLVFESTLGSPIKSVSLAAIIAWEELRKGQSVTVARIATIYDLMSTKVGVAYGFKTKFEKLAESQKLTIEDLRNDYGLITDKIWHEAFDRLSAGEREYFLAALRRGEKLKADPRIKISTIHGVKGGEADNVILCTDMAQRTFDEYHADPDSEHRVWYVAVTRARERLILLEPRTSMNYAI